MLQRAWKSLSGITHPKTLIFCMMLSVWLDLGIALVPLWRAHFTRIWPGFLFSFIATFSTLWSWTRSLPPSCEPNGEYAWYNSIQDDHYLTPPNYHLNSQSSKYVLYTWSYSDMNAIFLAHLQHFIISPSWMHFHLRPKTPTRWENENFSSACGLPDSAPTLNLLSDKIFTNSKLG